MKKELFILEHEILKTLLKKNSVMSGRSYDSSTSPIPTFKRDYSACSLHFGTLVDILNNEKKYENEKSLAGLILATDEIVINKYSWSQVSNAIEILLYNKQVQEILEPDKYGKPTIRKVTLTDKGAIDLRSHFYWKEYDEFKAIEREYEIQKQDKWQKEYWYLVELAKYIIGGVVGATIAFILTRST